MQTLQQMEQELLLDALRQHQGFHQGRPVAALLAFRCLHQWGCLTDDRRAGLVALVADELEAHLRQNLQVGPAA